MPWTLDKESTANGGHVAYKKRFDKSTRQIAENNPSQVHFQRAGFIKEY